MLWFLIVKLMVQNIISKTYYMVWIIQVLFLLNVYKQNKMIKFQSYVVLLEINLCTQQILSKIFTSKEYK